MALGFGADCIKIVVSMATDRSLRRGWIVSIDLQLEKLKKSSSLKPLGPQLCYLVCSNG